MEIRVIDQNFATIPQAIILLKTQGGKIIKEIKTEKTQSITSFSLTEGVYILEVSAIGFQPNTQNIKISNGKNSITVNLNVEVIKANVEINKDDLERRLDNVFETTFTEKQINALPESPNEIVEELKRRYGDDVVIRVDGFTGGQVPPKNNIASIRITKSSFDAEFHEIGSAVVDITTKAGGKVFIGFLNFFYQNSSLNARYSFSEKKLPVQNINTFGFLVFPSFNKNRTSISLQFVNFFSDQVNQIIAVKQNEQVNNQIKTGFEYINSTFIISHNLSKNHTLNTRYKFGKNNLSNLGVGGFSLPETAFSSNNLTHTLQLSESGPIKKTANQFRLEFVNTTTETVPNDQAVAINVIGAFNGGGATVNNSSSQQKLFLTDINYFDYKKHAFKIGGELEYVNYKLNSSDNLNGGFTFSSLADYLNNKPYSYTQRRIANSTNLSQIQLAGFIQDDIRLRKNFQIGLGLRYEWQNNLSDFNNFSPRLSFTWSPDKEARLVLRSGAGVFYHWFETPTLSTILGNDGRRGSDIIILNPSYPNPFLLGTTAQSLPPSIMQKEENLRNPYTFITKTGFNFRINNKYNLEGFYTYRKGVHQFRSRDINAPINGVRANTGFGRISQVESSGKTVENNLELKLEGKLKKGFSFDANYRLGKVLSDFEGIFSLPVNSYQTNQEWAFSNLDQRHRFNTRLNFPSWKSFSFNTTFRLESPRPYTITTGKDDNGDSVINDRPIGFQRNSERGEWFRQVDANFSWRTKLGKEDAKNPLSKLKNQLVFNVIVQNLFNQTNKQNFVGIQTSPFFRQAASAAPARTIRFGLSWMF